MDPGRTAGITGWRHRMASLRGVTSTHTLIADLTANRKPQTAPQASPHGHSCSAAVTGGCVGRRQGAFG